MRATITYDCEDKSNVRAPKKRDDSTTRDVYRSPTVDINIDLDTESEGYYPVRGCKDMFYSEFWSMIKHVMHIVTKIVA